MDELFVLLNEKLFAILFSFLVDAVNIIDTININIGLIASLEVYSSLREKIRIRQALVGLYKQGIS